MCNSVVIAGYWIMGDSYLFSFVCPYYNFYNTYDLLIRLLNRFQCLEIIPETKYVFSLKTQRDHQEQVRICYLWDQTQKLNLFWSKIIGQMKNDLYL